MEKEIQATTEEKITIQSLINMSAQDFVNWFMKNTTISKENEKVGIPPITPTDMQFLLLIELKLLKAQLAPPQNTEVAVENFMESVRDKQ